MELGTLEKSSPPLELGEEDISETIQFRKKPFLLSYFRTDIETQFRDFFCEISTHRVRAGLIVAVIVLFLRGLVILIRGATSLNYFQGSHGFIVGYGVVTLALGTIFCLIGIGLTYWTRVYRKIYRVSNPIIFLLIAIFPIITANIFAATILTHTALIECYLLVLGFGQYTHINFVESLFCGWLCFLYYVAALGIGSVLAPANFAIDSLVSLIIYMACGVIVFNFLAHRQERTARDMFEIFYMKQQQKSHLMVEIDDLKKKNIEQQFHEAPPDAPLTKAMKLLKQMDSEKQTLPLHLKKDLKEVMGILSSSRLYSPNMTNVGDQEIGAWLDYMLGQNPNATVRESALNLREDIEEAKQVERNKSKRTPLQTSKTNPFLERAQAHLHVSIDIQEKIDEVLNMKATWEFDIFLLSELTNGHPLLFLAHKIFVEEGFLFQFKIPEDVFLAFTHRIEMGYKNDNSYHNLIHAADVMHSTYYFIKNDIKKHCLSDLEFMASLVAAMVHDYAHPGVNNNFLIKIDHPLALRYNDRSVLENYHASETFKILKNPELNITSSMTSSQVSQFRSTLMELVLGTDVSHHFEYLSKFESRLSAGLNSENLEKKEDVLLVLTYIVKCSDMSNPARPPEINRKWVKRVMEEFYTQGDLEKELGFETSMFYDREKPNTPKCQTGFIDFLVRPMFNKWNVFSQSDASVKCSLNLESNYIFWKGLLEQNVTEYEEESQKEKEKAPKKTMKKSDLAHFGSESIEFLPLPSS